MLTITVKEQKQIISLIKKRRDQTSKYTVFGLEYFAYSSGSTKSKIDYHEEDQERYKYNSVAEFIKELRKRVKNG